MDRKEDYALYLKSPRWAELREEALIRDGRKCKLCASDCGLQVHHREYPKILGSEPLEDLVTLCSACHSIYHKKKESDDKYRTFCANAAKRKEKRVAAKKKRKEKRAISKEIWKKFFADKATN